jgi:hypothetical protein
MQRSSGLLWPGAFILTALATCTLLTFSKRGDAKTAEQLAAACAELQNRAIAAKAIGEPSGGAVVTTATYKKENAP